MIKSRHPFYRFSALVTAKDLETPLALSFDRDADAFGSYQSLLSEQDWHDRISLVMDKNEIVGWWWPFDTGLEEGSSEAVGDSMSTLPQSMIVSSGITFFDLADAFSRRSHPFYFVLDGAEITGTVSYLDLFSPTGQMCLLSLAFLLEASIEGLCVLRAEQCWNTLPERRKQLAEEIMGRRFTFARDLPPELWWPYRIRSTHLIDKGIMLSRCGLVASMSKAEIKSIVSTAERLRNLCAHNADEQELSRELPQNSFAMFLHRTQDLIEIVRLKESELRHS